MTLLAVLMVQYPKASRASWRYQQALKASAVLATRRAWGRVDPADISGSWSELASPLATLLGGLQRRASADGAAMVASVLEEDGTPVSPVAPINAGAVSGFLGQGFPAEDMLELGGVRAKALIANGMKPDAALSAAGVMLTGMVETGMADAGRQGSMLGVLARPKVGYVRMLNPPSCPRCAILAGFPSSRVPFARHPRCDCRAIPTLEDTGKDYTTDTRAYFESLGQSEQDRLFTKAGARAIRDGADINQVVNARRGMYTVQTPGSFKWIATREGTSRRGHGFAAMHNAGWVRPTDGVSGRKNLDRVRLMPETIYQVARSEEHALDLLRKYGYIL